VFLGRYQGEYVRTAVADLESLLDDAGDRPREQWWLEVRPFLMRALP
jgi:hypothetical protein